VGVTGVRSGRRGWSVDELDARGQARRLCHQKEKTPAASASQRACVFGQFSDARKGLAFARFAREDAEEGDEVAVVGEEAIVVEVDV
jgi:hypothetical protein